MKNIITIEYPKLGNDNMTKKIIKEKQMLLKKVLFIMVIGLMLISVNTFIAQEKSAEKKSEHTMMQDEDMHKCMDKIASDEHMRGDMMKKMMKETEGDSTGMMQMCKMMMDNPEMMKMMMKMMHGDSGMMKHDMMKDSTKESEHESHH